METSAQSAQSNQCGFEFIQVVGTTGNQSVIDTDLFKPESIFARKPDGGVPVAIWFAGLRDSEICNIDSGDGEVRIHRTERVFIWLGQVSGIRIEGCGDQPRAAGSWSIHRGKDVSGVVCTNNVFHSRF
jgi:hypothetical protein